MSPINKANSQNRALEAEIQQRKHGNDLLNWIVATYSDHRLSCAKRLHGFPDKCTCGYENALEQLASTRKEKK